MHPEDPISSHNPSHDPVVTTPVARETTIVEPAVPPAAAYAVTREPVRSMGPGPYIAGLLLLLGGAWGLMSLDSREVEPTMVTYDERPAVVQPISTPVVLEPPTVEVANEPIRHERPMPAEYDNQVASVDLSAMDSTPLEDAPAASRGAAPGALPSQVESVPKTPTDGPREVAVVDLDYSQDDIVPLTDSVLRLTVKKLGKDLQMTEGLANENGQQAGMTILDQRFDALNAQLQTLGAPLNQTSLVDMTRKVSELRDELSTFQTDVRTLPKG